ncbi:MAG: membrane dipeptidase [Chitinophagaceae bacterium]|nr:membrane dipeptidase [Chitinophagaceae bacterium]
MRYPFMLFLSAITSASLLAQVVVDPNVRKVITKPVLDNKNLHIVASLQHPLCEYKPGEKAKYVFYDNVQSAEVTDRAVPMAGEYITISAMVEGKEYTLIPQRGTGIGNSMGAPSGLVLAEVNAAARSTGAPPAPSLWMVARSGAGFSLSYNGTYMHSGTQWGETGGSIGLTGSNVVVGSSSVSNAAWTFSSVTENGNKFLRIQNTTGNNLLGLCYRQGQSVTLGSNTVRVVSELTPAALPAGTASSGNRVCVQQWFYKIYKITKAVKAKTYSTPVEPGVYFINTVHDNKSLLPFIHGVAFGETKTTMPEMQWQFEQTSRGTYFIFSKTKNMALGVRQERELQLRFIPVNPSNFYDTDSLQWIIKGPFEGKYSFAPLLSSRSPNVTNVLTTKNAVVVELEKSVNGSYWQEFMIDSVNGPLWGYTDMHTHPMSHLAFAGKNFHGAPDVGSMMYGGTIHRDAGFDVGETVKDCNVNIEKAKSVADALGNCNGTHGGWGTDNNCGDYLRNGFIGILEGTSDGAQSLHGSKVYGYNSNPSLAFTHWPKWNDMTHQKMWVDWIQMAYKSGLRVMVALAHNNQVMSSIIAYNDHGTPKDDRSAADLQVKEIIDFVNRHRSFMEVAYTPADMYRIVKSNKLAVVPGIEMDFTGNFPLHMQDNPESRRKVDAELDRLYTNGVRYIFPVHLSDNAFGGTAIYEDLMNVMQKLSTGTFWDIECSDAVDSITHKYEVGLDREITVALQAGLPLAPAMLEGISHLLPLPPGIKEAAQPVMTAIFSGMLGSLTPMLQAAANAIPDAPPNCGATRGHRNAKGLTSLGVYSVIKMMQKGMIIDVDHMSQYAVDSTLSIAKRNNYPVNSGHTGVRPASENQRTYRQLARITELGGLFGVGWSGQDAKGWIDNYKLGLKGMKNRGVCFGSDINSIVFTPKPRPGANIQYNDFGFAALSSYGRQWKYNAEGMAHYGMLRDFIRDIRNMNNHQELNVLYSSADDFYRMWDKCERNKRYVR